MRRRTIICALTALLLTTNGAAELQSLADKRASLGRGSAELDASVVARLDTVNKDLEGLRQQLHTLYDEVEALYFEGADEEQFHALVDEIRDIKAMIYDIEEGWRREAAASADQEPYALWHQPDTSLEELVMEYGSQDYVYLIPEEIAEKRVNIHSNLAIPHASWGELLEVILAEHGVAVRQVNPYLRQLVLVDEDLTATTQVLGSREALELIPASERVAFMLETPVTDVRRVFHFLERFAPKGSASVQLLGRSILIVASRAQVEELLKLYDFSTASYDNKDWRFVPLRSIEADEMTNILNTIFGVADDAKQDSAVAGQGLKIVPLKQLGQALFLLGTRSELEKAMEVINDIQGQLGEARDRMVYWYTVKHSDPEELAEVLSQVYTLMVREAQQGKAAAEATATATATVNSTQDFDDDYYTENVPFYAGGSAVVDPGIVNPADRSRDKKKGSDRDNFIVDPKTGSIVMVVESDLLPRIRDLLRRLDVPKKMVQIDVLLFEKRFTDSTSHGLNLLRIGDKVTTPQNYTGAAFSDGTANRGILDFMISRIADGTLPNYDVAYNFLLTQDDIQINAAPSVTTVNQTPAEIAIVDEISINTGVQQTDSPGGVRFTDTFARQQYGVVLKITPTIHAGNGDWHSEDEPNYITLETDVTFDTVQPGAQDSRPDVVRRNIQNLVQVADGETVILGGLRRLTSTDNKEAIPFLGEVPGIGKLFSNTEMTDATSEMFIFITPRIVESNREALERSRCQQLCRRPGDTPAFLQCLLEAQEYDRRRVYEGGLRMLLGRKEVPNLGGCR